MKDFFPDFVGTFPPQLNVVRIFCKPLLFLAYFHKYFQHIFINISSDRYFVISLQKQNFLYFVTLHMCRRNFTHGHFQKFISNTLSRSWTLFHSKTWQNPFSWKVEIRVPQMLGQAIWAPGGRDCQGSQIQDLHYHHYPVFIWLRSWI